jgi:hypothetical protein
MSLHRLVLLLSAVSTIVVAGSSSAQTAAKSGQSVRLHFYDSIDKDCTSLGKIVISMIRDPAHGKLRIVEAKTYPHFLATNPRVICNTTLLPATFVFYQSDPGFKGIDPFAYDVIFPLGHVMRQSLFVSVQ